MINRNYKEGEQLDVAGLNKITVLLDRSETESTEIGWNCWTPNQDGPPHKHNDKDQVFYVTGGVGIIKLGDKEYSAEKGCLAYVPAGLVHQTITTTEEKLCYMLFNVFKSENKEGHGTFAEHIEKVKQIRREQADTGNTEVDEEEELTDIKEHKYFYDLNEGEKQESGSNSAILLLEREEVNNFELEVINCSPSSKGRMETNSEIEQSFFILKGSGEVTINEETEKVEPGNLVFIPRKTPYATETFDEELVYLCLKSYAVKTEIRE